MPIHCCSQSVRHVLRISRSSRLQRDYLFPLDHQDVSSSCLTLLFDDLTQELHVIDTGGIFERPNSSPRSNSPRPAEVERVYAIENESAFFALVDTLNDITVSIRPFTASHEVQNDDPRDKVASLFLIRHAPSINNLLGKIQVHKWVSDPHLSDPDGWAVATALRHQWMQQLESSDEETADWPPSTDSLCKVFVSPFCRALQTAYEVLIGTPDHLSETPKKSPSDSNEKLRRFIVLPEMGEMRTSIGDVGTPYSQLSRLYSMRHILQHCDFETHFLSRAASPTTSSDIESDESAQNGMDPEHWWPPKHPVTQKESQTSLQRRIDKFLSVMRRELIASRQSIVCVGHSSFFKYVEARLTHTDPKDVAKIDNCSVLRVDFNLSKDRWQRCRLVSGGRAQSKRSLKKRVHRAKSPSFADITEFRSSKPRRTPEDSFDVATRPRSFEVLASNSVVDRFDRAVRLDDGVADDYVHVSFPQPTDGHRDGGAESDDASTDAFLSQFSS
ncbi:MAG: hypothetical protein MHM6MM_001111 [Cercozoa sp. M6MM]